MPTRIASDPRIGGQRSVRIRQLNDDPTAQAWKIQALAQDLVENGNEVIFLTVGDPDFSTPPAIVAQAIEYMQAGRTKYSPVLGEPGLRAAIASHEGHRFGQKIDQSQVVVFPGAQNALFNVMQAVAGDGDEVIVAEPYYATYPGVIAASGATLSPVQLDADRGFRLCVDQISAAITPYTRVVLLNSPGNPTGSIIDPETVDAIADLCACHGIWLISDEVYCDFTYANARDGKQHGFGRHFEDQSNLIIVNSVSKSLAMTGWRIGWAVMPSRLADELEPLLAAQLFGVPQFLQDTVAWALGRDWPETDQMRAQYEERRNLVTGKLSGLPGIACVEPAGGMFVMLDVSARFASGEQFSNALLRDKKVAVVPGFGFGRSAAGCVRISLTQPTETLATACDRIVQFIAAN